MALLGLTTVLLGLIIGHLIPTTEAGIGESCIYLLYFVTIGESAIIIMPHKVRLDVKKL